MKRLVMLFLLLLIPTLAVAATMKAPRIDKQELADLRMILKESKPGIPLTLNLSKPHHLRHVKRMLARQGLTPKNSPMMFKTLERMTAAHKKNAPSQRATLLQMTAAPEATLQDPPPSGGDWQTMGGFVTLGAVNQQDIDYQGTGLTTVPNGSIKSTMDLTLYDPKSGQPMGATAHAEQMGEGEDMQLVATGDMPGQPQPGDSVLGVLNYFIQPQNSGPIFQTVQLTQDVLFPQAPPTVNQPTQLASHAALPYIYICLSRAAGQTADCDLGPYEPPTGTPIVQFDMNGSVTYMANVITPLTALNTNTQFFIWKNDGGACAMNAQNVLQQMQPSNATINWNWRAQFQGAGGATNPCWQSGQRMDMSFMIAPTTASSGVQKVPAFITTLQNTQPYNTTQIKYLQFTWGCLLPGTKVKMADGSMKSVEEVEVGETVIANPDQDKRKVVNTYYGKEHKDVYYVTDTKGNTLALTENHPVLLTDGYIVLARHLKKGNIVYTLEGKAEIAKVEAKPYKGKVYNLQVEAGERDDFTDTSYYANGIMVGDNSMQNHWAAHYRKDAADTFNRIPAEWRLDYLNYRDRVAQKKK